METLARFYASAALKYAVMEEMATRLNFVAF